MSRILFFDDRFLHVVRHARRHMGRAKLMADTLYGDPDPNIFANIPNVFYSPTIGKWLMLTYGMHLRTFDDVVLLHESDDGLHWRPCDTREELTLQTRRFSHQLFELGACGEYSLYVDEREEKEEERFKLLAVRKGGKKGLESCLFTSADGLHWQDKQVEWHPSPPDLGPLCIYWNAHRGSYVIAARPAMVDRRVALIETTDWRHFTKPQVVLETDALDTPVCESYGLTVLPYDGHYLGLYWLFHPNAEQVVGMPGGTSGKYFDGYVDAQMTCSENGWYFKRSLREPVLANGVPGEPDCGCIYPRGMRMDGKGHILVDACVYPYEHGRWREFVHEERPHKSIGVYTIREDGFCYYQNEGGEAFLGSRALLYESGEVAFNVECPTGSFKVQVTDVFGRVMEHYSFDECIPFVGNSLRYAPRWHGGYDLTGLKGKTFRLEMRLKTGRLYAIHGGLKLILNPNA
ncbi:MAG: hypothetical protein Q4G52_00580 [Clostridia bacterium]|nr:hypothetical protein [Clostridia bacterium]